MKTYTPQEVAKKIQHTLVTPDASEKDIAKVVEECLTYQFDGAMVQPCWIPFVKKKLEGSGVKVCTALGFPMGGMMTSSKVAEVVEVFDAGADEIDFMPNYGWFKSGKEAEFQAEIAAVVQAAKGKTVKIMLEFGMLNREEKIRAATLAKEAGVTYLKNSSGWGQGGHATVEDIALLKEIANGEVGVKASGGIRNFDAAVKILNAGAELIGTSGSVKIVTGEGEESSIY
ncbi:deoxyribose-phosphate aldolase [Xylanibacillus composti]|uniref:Deoxyribose-phosphate aldolase n=1 Tax=Xylanibacillus composti TaxID=1572762 RepID=A0A8J4M2B1_9BACL|nr:deoxyribose-phosphate aldolase [Xylanibacillus composti]MDT9726526.1 deoxyribose-phosphate aldolase [Xylanibacillus composti]GIQ68945.1 deoxyribose-phosphate aldolase [Xylanibacillus composti]